MSLSAANGAKLMATVSTGQTVSHGNSFEWVQLKQTGPYPAE